MGLFEKTGSTYKSLTISTKRSVLDVWQGYGYNSETGIWLERTHKNTKWRNEVILVKVIM